MKKQNVRTISLIVCTFTYLLIGAAVFDALESETEKRRCEALQAVENMIIRKYNISVEDFKVMETVVLKSEPHKAGQQWKFTGAFYYATTVLTTIGYGHSTPSTIGGKLFTMCYAIVGIPLGLVMFQSIGERVNRLSSFVIQAVRTSLHCKRTAASEVDLICVVTTLSSLTIAGGAAAFSRFEGWSYFDSVYYCFITLTTIGFGDMVALQKDNALNNKPEYVMFALIFILFGLAIVAASLNLLVLRFVTMNTEDERRDEAQAMQALQGTVKLEGDVITANGSILSGYDGREEPSSMDEGASSRASTLYSCRCACFSTKRPHKSRNNSDIVPASFEDENGHAGVMMMHCSSSMSQTRCLLPEVVPMHELNYESHSSLNPVRNGIEGLNSALAASYSRAPLTETVTTTITAATTTSSSGVLLKRNVSLLSFQFQNI